MSQREAEKLEPSPNKALISICVPGIQRNFAGWDNLLTLDFHDIERPVPEYPDFILFTPKMAKQIIDFADALPNNVDWIMVHCHQGISRSAAVAKYLCEKYGEPFPKDYKYANTLVYQTLKLGGVSAPQSMKSRWSYAGEYKNADKDSLNKEAAEINNFLSQVEDEIKREGKSEERRIKLDDLNRRKSGIEMVIKHFGNKEDPKYMEYYKLKTPLDPSDIKARSYIMKKNEPPQLLPPEIDHLHYARTHGWQQLDEPDYDKWYLNQGYTKTTIFRNEFTVLGNDKRERDRLAMFLDVKAEDLKPG